MTHKLILCSLFLSFAAFAMLAGKGAAYDRPERKPAIVLAAFGTTDVEAVRSILHIMDRVEKEFPEYDVHLAFTSNIVRGRWKARATDAAFRRDNPEVPETIYSVNNALATLAAIQEDGARLILVQSLHVADGEEYADLANLVAALENYETMKRSLHPFPWIGVGAPALGVGDGQEAFMERAAVALGALAGKAAESGAALVLMGHGNEHLNQRVFAKLEKAMRRRYGPHVYIGTVEAPPFAEDIAEILAESEDAPKKIFLAPLMVVAGDHAKNDMAGDEDDSWANIFREAGFEVDLHMVGLGFEDSWADIYVEHLKALEAEVLEKKARDNAEEDEGDAE